MITFAEIENFIKERENADDYSTVTKIRSKANSACERLKKRGVRSPNSTAVVTKDEKALAKVNNDIDPRAKQLAVLLQKLIRENFTWWHKGYSTDKLASVLRQTAIEIERINRIDKFDYETIETVIRWSQQDDFWKENIQSGKKLRKQFETLLSRVQRHYERKELEEV